jgi:predicted 2-oxoglutarate/Fe(II)-dependent dioxygenase YbiX
LTFENEKIKFGSGEGLVFTSLIAHKVTPITKGERITLTYWGEGPTWR